MPKPMLFQPLQLGRVTLDHRIVMAPLTRFRCAADHVPGELCVQYYTQRASTPGTLIIAESSLISPAYGNFPNAPGIWNEAQIQGWKAITDAIHKRGCFIICQLNAPGRAAKVMAESSKQEQLLSSSAVAIDETRPVPREMTTLEIETAVEDYAQAAKNAVAAGFDGVEIHGANGYLVDQFTQDTCNQRKDEYGGSVENRARFAIEVATAVVAAVGYDRVGFRISPYSTYNGMLMKDPAPGFACLVSKLKELRLAYLHIIEPRVSNFIDVETTESIDFLKDIWGRTSPILLAGGYSPDRAKTALEGRDARFGDVAVVFGRHFLANPDLVYRIKEDLPLNKYDRSSFYTPEAAEGYVDYPFHVPSSAMSAAEETA